MSQLTSVLLVTAGALVGGAVGSLATVKLLGPEGGAAKLGQEKLASGTASAVKADDDPTAALDALRGRLSSLERRLSLLTFAQAHSSPDRAEDANGAAPAGAASAGKPEKTVDDPVFEAAVRDVLDQVEDERNAERSAQRSEARAAQTARWLDALSKQLDLRSDQQEKLKAIAEERFNAMRALRNNAGTERPVLRSEWRARMQALSDKAEQQLSSVLDATQKQKYDALEDADKLGSGGWRRGGEGRAGENRTGENRAGAH